MNFIKDALYISKIEEALESSSKGPEQILRYKWEPLPGTGSTSERSLVTAIYKKYECKFAIKTYCIEVDSSDESLKQSVREYQVLKTLEQFFGDIWKVPKPFCIIPEYATIIIEYCPGQNLNNTFWHMVRLSAFSLTKKAVMTLLMRDIAIILGEMQSIKNFEEGLPIISKEWYLSFLDEQLKELSILNVDQNLLDMIHNKFVEGLKQFLADENICFQHTDYYFNNIIVLENEYSILDFPNACIGSKYWDISHIMVSLEDFKRFKNVSDRLINICQDEFIRHFHLDGNLLDTMMLLHYSYSYKIALMSTESGLKKILKINPKQFYENKINKILETI